MDMIRQPVMLVSLTFIISFNFCNETSWALESALITPLPQLISTSAWQVDPCGEKILAISEAPGNLIFLK
jgi:hypothetical protein